MNWLKCFLVGTLVTVFTQNVTYAAITDRDKAELGITQNYLTNGGCESSTTGFSAFNTTFTSDIPTTITSGSSVLSVTRVTTNVLQGQASCQLNLTTSAGSVGNGIITDPITIKDADLAKVLAVQFDYNFVTNPGNVDVSGTNTQTIELWVYNVGRGTWYQPAGYRSINTKGTTSQLVPGRTPTITFQSDVSNTSNNNQYRIAWIIKNAPAGTFQMNFDNVTFGRPVRNTGPAVSDSKSYTPTLSFISPSGTNASNIGFYRQVGEYLEATIQTTLGSTGSGSSGVISWSLPAGLSIDTSKLPTTAISGTRLLPGSAIFFDSSAGVFVDVQATVGTTGQVSLVKTGTGLNISGTDLGANDVLNLTFRAPIAGWSSNTVMSNDTDTRVVAATYTGLSSTTITSGTGLRYTTLVTDTHSSYNISTGAYVAPVSGIYQITVAGTLLASSVVDVRIFKNGVSASPVFHSFSVNTRAGGTVQVPLVAGDSITINPSAAVTAADTNGIFTIQRLSGPSVVAASESVNMKYTSSTTTVGTSQTILIFPNRLYDSHNAYDTSTGLYTCPIGGKYRISSQFRANAGATASGVSQAILNAQKNGVVDTLLDTFVYQVASTSIIPAFSGSGELQCLAGETLSVSAGRDAAINSFSLNGTTTSSILEISRIGN